MFWNRTNGKYASMPATAMLKPLARSEDLIIEEVDDEVLVYDERTARAHCLSADAARVWRACDGDTDEYVIATKLDLDSDTVTRALAELEEKQLLDPGPVLNGNGATRREFGLKAAKIGAAVTAGPMIYSIVAPTAIASVTTPEIVCNFYSGSGCDACTAICGCCCCCQGCSSPTNPSCKMCSSVSGCPLHTDGCQDQLNFLADTVGLPHPPPCSSGPNCSATAKDPPKCLPGCVPCTTSPSGFCPNNSPDACGGHDCNCFGIGNPCCLTPQGQPCPV